MKLKEEDFPQFACPVCGNLIQLDFMPRNNLEKLHEVVCKVCGYDNQKRESL